LLCGRGAFELVEGFAQLLKSAVDTNLNGANFAAQQTPDFVVLEFLEAA